MQCPRLSVYGRPFGTRTRAARWLKLNLSILGNRSGRRRNFRLIGLSSRFRGGRMFCVEICRLERRSSGLIGWCCGCLFATLQAVAHPFAHARLLTQKRVRDQSAGIRRTMPDSGGTGATAARSTGHLHDAYNGYHV